MTKPLKDFLFFAVLFGSSHCQPLNIINLWRAASVIHLLYNSGINIGEGLMKIKTCLITMFRLFLSFKHSSILCFGQEIPLFGHTIKKVQSLKLLVKHTCRHFLEFQLLIISKKVFNLSIQKKLNSKLNFIC